MPPDAIVRNGVRFKVEIKPDDCSDAPWQREDGHGPVRLAHNWRTGWRSPKFPGERILHEARGTAWFYDWQAACKLARKDGWNVEPFDAPNRIERAVQADFDRLRRWLSNDWCYVGVIVTEVSGEGYNALWGIESDAGDYLDEVVEELVDELLMPRLRAWRAALKRRRAQRAMEQLEIAIASPF